MRRLRQKLEVDAESTAPPADRPRRSAIGSSRRPPRRAVARASVTPPRRADPRGNGLALSFQTRLTLTLLAAAIVPLGLFGVLLIATGAVDAAGRSPVAACSCSRSRSRSGILGGAAVGLDLVRPLREISAAVVARLGRRPEPADPGRRHRRPGPAGREPQPPGRATPQRRNRQLGADPGRGRIRRAARRRRRHGRAGSPRRARPPSGSSRPSCGSSIPTASRRRSGSRASRSRSAPSCAPATSASASSSPACRRPGPGNGPTRRCFDLYASEIGVAIRNAELFDQVQEKNVQLRRLSEVKDDFLRGVSHNLQTPLDVDPLECRGARGADRAGPAPDDHLGPGRSADPDGPAAAARQPARVAAAAAERRRPGHRPADPAGMGCAGRQRTATLELRRRRPRLAGRRRRRPARPGPVGPPRQRGQVRGRRGRRSRSAVESPKARTLWTTITDHGRGLDDSDRAWLFGRFERGGGRPDQRQRQRPRPVRLAGARCAGWAATSSSIRRTPGRGATFRLTLPAEAAGEA